MTSVGEKGECGSLPPSNNLLQGALCQTRYSAQASFVTFQKCGVVSEAGSFLKLKAVRVREGGREREHRSSPPQYPLEVASLTSDTCRLVKLIVKLMVNLMESLRFPAPSIKVSG